MKFKEQIVNRVKAFVKENSREDKNGKWKINGMKTKNFLLQNLDIKEYLKEMLQKYPTFYSQRKCILEYLE